MTIVQCENRNCKAEIDLDDETLNAEFLDDDEKGE